MRAEVNTVAMRNSGRLAGVFGIVQIHDQVRRDPPLLRNITPRQFQMLEGLVEGYSTRQIAEVHTISPETVRTHMRELFRTLGVDSRLKAVLQARRLGLI